MPCCTSPEMVPTGSSPLRSCHFFCLAPPRVAAWYFTYSICAYLGENGTLETPFWSVGQIFEWHLGQWSLGKSNGRNFQLRSKKKTHSKFAPENGGLGLLPHSFPFGSLPILRCGKLPVSFRFRVVMMVSSSRGTRLRAEARLKTCDQICFVPPGNGTEQLVYEALKGQIFPWWYSRFQSFNFFLEQHHFPFFLEMIQFDEHIFFKWVVQPLPNMLWWALERFHFFGWSSCRSFRPTCCKEQRVTRHKS